MKVKVSGIIKLYIILVKRLAKAGLVLWFGMVFILKLCLFNCYLIKSFWIPVFRESQMWFHVPTFLAAESSSVCRDVRMYVTKDFT